MPEIVLPLALVDFPSGHIVIHSHSVLHLIDEGALVLVTTPVEVTSLDEGRRTQGLALESVAIRIVDERLAHHCCHINLFKLYQARKARGKAG